MICIISSTGEVSAASELDTELPKAFLRERKKRKFWGTYSCSQEKYCLNIMGIAEECSNIEDICQFLIANL